MTLRHRDITALAFALAAIVFGWAALSAAPAFAAAPKGAGCSNASASPGSISTGQARKATLCLINAERKQHGLGSLDRNKKLQKAAQRHNDRMLGSGCFDHECPGEPDLGGRLENVSYLVGGLLKWAFGENLAWGNGDLGSPRAIVKAWMASPGHRANILHRDFKEIGIGFSVGTPSSKKEPGGIYTTDFGLRVG